jgi:hypothetical protein
MLTVKRYVEAALLSLVALVAIATPTVILLQDGSHAPVQIVFNDPLPAGAR